MCFGAECSFILQKLQQMQMFQFGMSQNIHPEMYAYERIFRLKEAWFKVGTKQKQRQHGKHVRLLFPFWFAGAKVGP